MLQYSIMKTIKHNIIQSNTVELKGLNKIANITIYIYII
jgi:hypothetical protein